MFGHPTGLGALLVRVDAAEDLRKQYWGGGAVALATRCVDTAPWVGPSKVRQPCPPVVGIDMIGCEAVHSVSFAGHVGTTAAVAKGWAWLRQSKVWHVVWGLHTYNSGLLGEEHMQCSLWLRRWMHWALLFTTRRDIVPFPEGI